MKRVKPNGRLRQFSLLLGRDLVRGEVRQPVSPAARDERIVRARLYGRRSGHVTPGPDTNARREP